MPYDFLPHLSSLVHNEQKLPAVKALADDSYISMNFHVKLILESNFRLEKVTEYQPKKNIIKFIFLATIMATFSRE